MTPLDEATYKLAAQTMNRARVHGVAPVVALHQAGLILSDDVARQIRADVLRSAVEHLRNSRLRHLMPDPSRYMREGATPTQTRDAIADALEALAELARKGEFR